MGIASAPPVTEKSRVDFRGRLLALDALHAWRDEVRASGRRLVATNGCFDLLHLGHVTYLEAARNLGDLLLVGVNGDASVRALKGAGRPVNSEQDRALVLAALESVSAVCVFPEMEALSFLRVARPDIYAKGGDYQHKTLPERPAVEAYGGQVILIDLVPERSTSALIARVRALPGAS